MADTLENRYKISRCNASEFCDLVDFLQKYWKDDHIFVKCPALLKWQHLDGSFINFIIARETGSNRILGIFGFIPTSQFDKDLSTNKDTWGAIWKVTDDAPYGLGMNIMQFFHDEVKPLSHVSVSNTDIALNLYKLTRQKTGYLNQYYILSDSVKQYTIAKPGRKNEAEIRLPDEVLIKEIRLSSDFSLSHPFHPQKSITYLINRYQNHPIYKYRFFGIYEGTAIFAIFVIRKQFANNSSCLRLVDIYGEINSIGRAYHQLQKLIMKEESEYIDCCNYGIDEAIFARMGFVKLDPEGDTIIPNYFEPFEQRNVAINFAIKMQYSDYIIFKGDADQDRPSIIKDGNE
ncbi:MAG: hypothetical protein KKG99_06075 [Bacteroidetes bacterium]|nr:hypothetical protein [Bacteroidota bacterium]